MGRIFNTKINRNRVRQYPLNQNMVKSNLFFHMWGSDTYNILQLWTPLHIPPFDLGIPTIPHHNVANSITC